MTAAVKTVIRREHAPAHGGNAENAEEIAESQGSRKSPLVIAHLLPERVGEIVAGFRTVGRERSIMAFRILKMAVLAPMPSASERAAVAAKPGFARSVRRA